MQIIKEAFVRVHGKEWWSCSNDECETAGRRKQIWNKVDCLRAEANSKHAKMVEKNVFVWFWLEGESRGDLLLLLLLLLSLLFPCMNRQSSVKDESIDQLCIHQLCTSLSLSLSLTLSLSLYIYIYIYIRFIPSTHTLMCEASSWGRDDSGW